MEREWQRAVRYRLPLSCMVMDVDYFEKINERYGQAGGDAVLKVVAGTLLSYSRAADLTCRLSGDRFLVLLLEANESHAGLLADRVRSAVERASVSVDGESVRVTASAGVAQRFADTANLDALVELAEQALAVAKQSGRNRTVRYRLIGDTSDLKKAADRLNHAPLDGLTARDVMTAPIACLRHEDTARQAAQFLFRYRINSAPVVDRQHQLVGILSEKDLMSQVTWPDSAESPIYHFMCTDVVYFQEDDPAHEIYDFLCGAAIRRVIIVKDGRPTGVISRGTVLRWLADSGAGHLAEALDHPLPAHPCTPS
jgi:diguanylate cyclase (GGDEF)-like protein